MARLIEDNTLTHFLDITFMNKYEDMTFEEAKRIFYENQKVQDEFDFKKVDYLFSKIETIIEDIENLKKAIAKDPEKFLQSMVDVIDALDSDLSNISKGLKDNDTLVGLRETSDEIKEMLAGLIVGDKIVTIGGIVGKITSIKDDEIVIETGSPAEKSYVKFQRSAVREVLKAAPEEK